MSRYSNIRGVASIALLAGMIVACMHGLWPASAMGQEVPFVGIVDEASVDVRAGAARNFYVVARLQKGALVNVEEMLSGWHMITPPAGTFSIISKAHVDAKGDGKMGVVNAERAVVRAAGIDTPAKEWFRTQVNMRKGDTVQIVGEVDSFYKIVPPESAVVYLPPGAVRRATAEEIRRANQPPVEEVSPPAGEAEPLAPAPVAPVDEAVAEPPAPPEPPAGESVELATPFAAETAAPPAPGSPAPESAAEPSEVAEPAVEAEPVAEVEPAVVEPEAEPEDDSSLPRPVAPSVRAVEMRMREVEKMDLIEQPLAEMLQAFRLLRQDSQLVATDRFIVDSRIAQIERNVQVAEILRQGTNLHREMESRPTVDVKALERQEMLRAGYVAMGVLSASTVYDGLSLPRLYRLLDPSNRRTIAYVRPDMAVDARLMGKLVGIYGQMRYDPALKLRLIDVKELDVLEAQAKPPAPQPAAPPAADEPAPDAAPAPPADVVPTK